MSLLKSALYVKNVPNWERAVRIALALAQRHRTLFCGGVLLDYINKRAFRRHLWGRGRNQNRAMNGVQD